MWPFRKRRKPPPADQPERQDMSTDQHDPETEDQSALPEPDPLTDSGVHAAPDTRPLRQPCPACFGTGHVLTTSDLLRQSLGLLGNDPAAHHRLVAEFYRRLLVTAPWLVPLFPADLTDPMSEGEGKFQRDRLLSALVAVGQMYDPDHPDSEEMQILRTHLETYGRLHANFANRPDGRERGATVLEYAAVFNVLMGALHDAVGPAWVPVFDVVWEEAYDFAARGMIASTWTSGFRAARYPRP